MNDKRSSKSRMPPSWIYYFCWFWSQSTSGSSRRHNS